MDGRESPETKILESLRQNWGWGSLQEYGVKFPCEKHYFVMLIFVFWQFESLRGLDGRRSQETDGDIKRV